VLARLRPSIWPTLSVPSQTKRPSPVLPIAHREKVGAPAAAVCFERRGDCSCIVGLRAGAPPNGSKLSRSTSLPRAAAARAAVIILSSAACNTLPGAPACAAASPPRSGRHAAPCHRPAGAGPAARCAAAARCGGRRRWRCQPAPAALAPSRVALVATARCAAAARGRWHRRLCLRRRALVSACTRPGQRAACPQLHNHTNLCWRRYGAARARGPSICRSVESSPRLWGRAKS